MFVVPLENKNCPVLSHHIFKLQNKKRSRGRENKEILGIHGLQIEETVARNHINLLLDHIWVLRKRILKDF